MANSVPNFRVGLQVADQAGTSGEGEPRYTSWAKDASVWSEWAIDSDQHDPDAVKVGLEVEMTNLLTDRDFRLEIQAADARTQGPGFDLGPKQFTPWASEGGGSSGLVTDTDAFDPDAFRMKIQTRPWTSTRTLKDMRLGIQLFDQHGAELGNVMAFTPWASEGGGWSDYAVDRDQFDPDGLKIRLEVRFD